MATAVNLKLINIMCLSAFVQVVAYNKIDLPDSADYADDVREFLEQEGVAGQNIVAISAATGQGVLDVVRRTRVLLDEMPEPVRALSSCLPKIDVAASPLSCDHSNADFLKNCIAAGEQM